MLVGFSSHMCPCMFLPLTNAPTRSAITNQYIHPSFLFILFFHTPKAVPSVLKQTSRISATFFCLGPVIHTNYPDLSTGIELQCNSVTLPDISPTHNFRKKFHTLTLSMSCFFFRPSAPSLPSRQLVFELTYKVEVPLQGLIPTPSGYVAKVQSLKDTELILKPFFILALSKIHSESELNAEIQKLNSRVKVDKVTKVKDVQDPAGGCPYCGDHSTRGV